MSGGSPGRLAAVLIVLAVVLTTGAFFAVAEPVAAKGKAPTCPKKIGGFKTDGRRVGDNVVDCYYTTRKWNARDGSITLAVFWRPDTPDERAQCDYRDPPPLDPSTKGSYHGTLFRSDRAAYGNYSLSEGRRIKQTQAEAALRKLIGRAAPLAHPCVPEPEPVVEEALACPLVIGGMFVRDDWYGGDPPAVETGRSEDGATEYALECDYRYAYRDDSQSGNLSVDLRVSWWEGDPENFYVGTYCRALQHDGGSDTLTRDGVYPLEVRIDSEFAAAGGQELADTLARVVAARTPLCPGASAPDSGPGDAPAPDVTTTTTTIVLSGGPGEEPPPVTATIPMPEDDQHRIVIGGLEGEVIREEVLGDQATIISYGPMARDAEGNWTVSVEVEASIAPAPPLTPQQAGPDADAEAEAEPDAEAEPATEAEPDTAAGAEAEPAPEPDTEVEPEAEPAADAPPAADAEDEPDTEPEPDTSPTPVPPPEMVGVPEALDDYVAGLEPEAAGAVRNLTDYLGALGDEIIQQGSGQVTIPPSDIAELKRLAPGIVDEIKLVSGGFIVDSYVEVRVTPVIGQDGLIEFRTNRLQDTIRAHEIVKALVLALNNYVVESGGRFRTISVTPEGLTVTAERRAED